MLVTVIGDPIDRVLGGSNHQGKSQNQNKLGDTEMKVSTNLDPFFFLGC